MIKILMTLVLTAFSVSALAEKVQYSFESDGNGIPYSVSIEYDTGDQTTNVTWGGWNAILENTNATMHLKWGETEYTSEYGVRIYYGSMPHGETVKFEAIEQGIINSMVFAFDTMSESGDEKLNPTSPQIGAYEIMGGSAYLYLNDAGIFENTYLNYGETLSVISPSGSCTN